MIVFYGKFYEEGNKEPTEVGLVMWLLF